MGHPAESADVYSVVDHLRGTIDFIESVDRDLHDRLRNMRERLFALELAEDPEVRASMGAAAEALARGDLGDSVTLDEFRSRYLSSC